MGKTVPVSELAQFSTGQDAMIDGIHVARNECHRRRDCIMDVLHVLFAHDDGAKARNLRVTSIENNNVRLVLGRVERT